VKEVFIPRMGYIYIYPLLREERGKIYKFIDKQLRKEYIRPLKLSQIAQVFFVEKIMIESI